MKKLNLLAALATATLAAPLALAQSHSITNQANPPQKQSDTKAGTAATPGRSATAERHDSSQASPAANKPNGEWKPPVSKPTDDKGRVRNDIGAAQAGNEAKETMQMDPSERQVNPVERQALDVSPAAKK